jgi:hypothetical protein
VSRIPSQAEVEASVVVPANRDKVTAAAAVAQHLEPVSERDYLAFVVAFGGLAGLALDTPSNAPPD